MPQPYLAQPNLQSVSQPTLQSQLPASLEDEIIPTAIVIKNIPFNVKRETLLDIIASLSIPTPYAFNYHLDAAGQFRGLAFANFRLPADADAVVAALNGFDVQGRKLRVEYKKVLQAGEKERIEREKALRRMRSMQLEKERQNQADGRTEWDEYGQLLGQTQGMPIAMPSSVSMPGVGLSPPGMPVPSPARTFSGSLQTLGGQQQQSAPPIPPLQIPQVTSYPQQIQSAMPSLQSTQQSLRSMESSPPPGASKAINELDLNDEATLEIYSRILVFKEDRMRDELAFSRTLTPKQRRIVHLVAQKLGVYHYSIGEGEERYAVVTRNPDHRTGGARHPSQTLSRAPSSYLSPTSATSPSRPSPSSYSSLSLRSKKSMPDLASLHAPPQRLQSRASNGNIREGYATIASPSRRNNPSFNNLFASTSSSNGNGSSIPPVPTLPSLPILETSGGVVRQPRGPGVGGFGRRVSEIRSPGGLSGELDTRTHEPLEI
jgi:RNA recognition motif-containing protein